MAGITYNITNIDAAFKKMDKFSADVQKEVKNEIAASALKIQADAKRAAPVNLGKLRQSIYMYEINEGAKFAYKVGTNESYAPYVEFGTPGIESKQNMKIPSQYADFAMQFKGRSQGRFKDMVKALMEWGLKKGYINPGKGAKQHAYFMALKILKRGLRAQPFLLPAYDSEKSKLTSRLKNIINNVKS